jgi:chromosome segregation protein
VRYEEQQSLLTGSTKERTLLNEQLHDANDHSQQIQEAFYRGKIGLQD